MAIGAVILMVVGFCFVSFFSFPDGISRQIRSKLNQAWNRMTMGRVVGQMFEAKDSGETFREVVEETSSVEIIIRRLMQKSQLRSHAEDGSGDDPPAEDTLLSNVNDLTEFEVDSETTSRDSIPAVLSYKLRKVYPSLGGIPPKVALESLDIHVPKGQVLGLLGQNGAGR